MAIPPLHFLPAQGTIQDAEARQGLAWREGLPTLNTCHASTAAVARARHRRYGGLRCRGGQSMGLAAFLPLFLTAGVEWVEAFTIVLAVSLTIGWTAALGAAAAALGTLAALAALTGGALSAGLNVQAI